MASPITDELIHKINSILQDYDDHSFLQVITKVIVERATETKVRDGEEELKLFLTDLYLATEGVPEAVGVLPPPETW